MDKNLKISVLTEPINHLSLSSDFKRMAEVNGFETLDEVLSFTVASLFRRSGFSIHVYHELYKFLEKEGYSDLLKTE